jgi:hypothetical protein
MRCLIITAIVSATLIPFTAPLAQGLGFGFAGGMSLVGSSSGRRISADPYPVSGGDQPGVNARAYLELDNGDWFGLRGELAYTRLKSGASTYSTCCGDSSKAALRDETYGVFMSSVLMLPPNSDFHLYLVGGPGVIYTRLSSNPTAGETSVADRRSGTGFGAVGGLGLRARTGGMVIAIEARYQQSFGRLRGSPVVPISIAIEWD